MNRPDFIGRARKIIAEIELEENTRRHWNESVRKPDEAEIPPWPEIDAVKRKCLAVIKREEGRKP